MANVPWWYKTYYPWDPFPESEQSNAFRFNVRENGSDHPFHGSRRHAPAETPYISWVDGFGWHQGGHKLRNFKSKKYWARPVDGGNRGTLGRLKDGFTGRGADVFVVANGDRRTLHRDMPGRNHWSNWDTMNLDPLAHLKLTRREREEYSGDPDWYPPGNLGPAAWAGRSQNKVYNFRNRKYETIRLQNAGKFWSDAHFGNKGGKDALGPMNWRNAAGTWRSRVPLDAGYHPGGRPQMYN